MFKNVCVAIVMIVLFSCSNPSGTTEDKTFKDSCDLYARKAESLFNSKSYLDVIRIPESTLQCDSSTKLKVMTYKGMSLQMMKRYPESFEYFNSLIAMHPGDAPLYGRRALAYESMNNPEKAMVDYNKALSLDSTLMLERNNRATLYQASGNYEAAKQDFDIIIRRDSLAVAAYNNRGMLYQKINKDQLAIRDFEKGLSIEATDYLFFSLATSQYNIGLFKEALNSLNKAIELNPKDPAYYSSRGYVKLQLKDKTGACADFHSAKALGANVSEELEYCK